MNYVKHNKWFYTNIDGVEYRGRYFDYGFTYASLQLQVLKTRKVSKYFLFGPMIEKPFWETIVESSRESFSPETRIIYRAQSYTVNETKDLVTHLVKNCNYVHTERI